MAFTMHAETLIINQESKGTVYYSPHAIVVLAHNFNIVAGDRTLERKTMRLLLSCNSTLNVWQEHTGYTCHGMLLAPNACIKKIDGNNTDIILIDLPITSTHYRSLDALLAGRSSLTLEKLTNIQLAQISLWGQQHPLNFNEIENLVEKVIHHAINKLSSGKKNNSSANNTNTVITQAIDPRVSAATRRIKKTSLQDIRLKDFAEKACLSPDRFRHLFKEETGATFSHYARSFAVWKTLALWETKTALTDACLAAGFYDLSHFYRAYYETFGIHWKENNNPRKLKRVRFYETLTEN